MHSLKRTLVAALLSLVPVFAQGQLLDFDTACPVTPCAIGSLYSASGVTFTPGNPQVVAAGTGNITGSNGGRYLSVNTSPYQLSVLLARPATYFSMQLARSNASSGAFAVQVTWFKSGAVVGSRSVTLLTVGKWYSVAEANIPGGVDSLLITSTGQVVRSFGIDNLQFGGTCNGFADVVAADAFCNATEWLANRNVTLGCVAGQYCPAANVTRAQMALFMNRLGDALAPRSAYRSCALGAVNLDAANALCPTDDIFVAGHPRRAVVHASVSAALTAAGGATMNIVYSIDGGTTWTPFPNQASAFSVPDSSTTTNATVLGADFTVTPGPAYRFAVRLSRLQGSGDVSGANVQIRVEMHGMPTGAAAPFDAAADGDVE